jgi:hypothetical protein
MHYRDAASDVWVTVTAISQTGKLLIWPKRKQQLWVETGVIRIQHKFASQISLTFGEDVGIKRQLSNPRRTIVHPDILTYGASSWNLVIMDRCYNYHLRTLQ